MKTDTTRMCCGHHSAFLSYQKRLYETIADDCPGYNIAPCNITYIMEDWTFGNNLYTIQYTGSRSCLLKELGDIRPDSLRNDTNHLVNRT